MAPCDWHPLGNRVISVQHMSVLPFCFLFVHLVLESYVGPVFTKRYILYPKLFICFRCQNTFPCKERLRFIYILIS